MAQDPDAVRWVKKNLEKSELTDVRRVRRLAKLGEQMARRPGESLVQLCKTPYDVKATYNLLKHPEVTPEHIQAWHRKVVNRKLREQGQTTLLVEDTSELSWNRSYEIPGLGPTGDDNPRVQGFHLHSVLAMRWSAPVDTEGPYKRAPVEVLGLANQLYYVRKPIPEGEDGNRSNARLGRERESKLWIDTGQHLGRAPEGARWVRVCDRAADIYEFLEGCQQLAQGFVVRAAQDRALVEPGGRLFTLVRSLDGWAEFTLNVRPRPERAAHTARLHIAAVPVSIRSPARPGAPIGKLPPICCTAVRVWEPEPPEGSKPLEWILLTDAAVGDVDQALTVALQYATRWVIEDFHKALKTGLGAERLALESAHALFAAISIMSLTALRLVDLRERLRIDPQAPAQNSGLDELELKILHRETGRKLKTVNDVALAVGRMGGHMNRKADGMPGLVTLWRGLVRLQTLARGARHGIHLSRFG